MRPHILVAAAALSLAGGSRALAADTGDTTVSGVEVTATRTPEKAETVPAYISLISGEELRARGARDLRGALALVAGAEAPPGGDNGPAGAVPSFWGLHEFDAFLLVVDGVPWGGAFNPAIPTLDLNDVERVEVLKGSAPVIYGATAFVGVIQVIHYPAGQAADEVEAGYGNHGSYRARGSIALPSIVDISQSLAVDAQRDGYAIDREKVRDARALYRAAGPFAGGTFRLDADVSIVRSVPPSPVVRIGDELTPLAPIDANYNPADARINENRYHAVLGFTHDTPLGLYESTASIAFSHVVDVRGFLRTDLNDDGSANADSQAQVRSIVDIYNDGHFSRKLGGVDLVFGSDLLYGEGRQQSVNGEYYAPLSGRGPILPTTALHVDEVNGINDRRLFTGQYVQADWKLGDRLDINGGVRLNETYEHKNSTHIDGFDANADEAFTDHRNVVRPSGTIGVSYQAWRDGEDAAVLFADYRNSFKPSAIDFGPDVTPAVLKPETARTYEVGLKGHLLGGRFDYQAGLFLLNFSNLVVATTDASGAPILENAGGERLKGAEVEAHWRLTPDLSLAGSFSWHDARFTHYVATEGGTNIDVSGNQLTLSPRVLASAGLVYQPAQGPFGTVTVNYIGRRYLDLANQAPTPGYTTIGATVGYRWGRYKLWLEGDNLSDQRPPVTSSEFGDQSYYLLPGRSVFVNAGVAF